jgi:hypothetical protein
VWVKGGEVVVKCHGDDHLASPLRTCPTNLVPDTICQLGRSPHTSPHISSEVCAEVCGEACGEACGEVCGVGGTKRDQFDILAFCKKLGLST